MGLFRRGIEAILNELEEVEEIEARLFRRLDAILEGHRRKHNHNHVWLTVNGVSVKLIPNQEIHMSVSVTVGHTVTFGIAQVDTSGNPMLTPVTFDAAPTWGESSTDGSIETLAVSTDGLSAVGTTTGVGTDTVTPTVLFGGVSFSASVDVVVLAPPQTFGGIQVTTAVS